MDRASIFGSPLRDRILAILEHAGSSHARELAVMLDASPEGVGKAVRRLEKDGLIVAIARGRTRVLQLNVRWFASRELRALLDKMIEFEPRLASAAEVVRKRPRRSGKPL